MSAVKRLLSELLQNAENDDSKSGQYKCNGIVKGKGKDSGEIMAPGSGRMSLSSAQSVINLRPISDENLFKWTATILGPYHSPYEGCFEIILRSIEIGF